MQSDFYYLVFLFFANTTMVHTISSHILLHINSINCVIVILVISFCFSLTVTCYNIYLTGLTCPARLSIKLMLISCLCLSSLNWLVFLFPVNDCIHAYIQFHVPKKSPLFPPQQTYVSPSNHQMAPPSPNSNTTTISNGSSNSSSGGEQLSKTNLYIRGLHPGTTDQDLVKLCQP